MSDAKHLVFVYGTLKTGERNFGRFLSDAKSLGAASTLEPGFLMTHHQSATSPGKYTPDAVRALSGGSYIEGEVFEVDDLQLFKLDRLEGARDPHSAEEMTTDEKYYREEIRLADGRVAWAYLSKNEESSEQIPHIIYNDEANSFRWKEPLAAFPS